MLALWIAIGLVGLQRIAELFYDRHTARILVAKGAAAIRPDGFGLLLIAHTVFFVGSLAEGLWAPWPELGPWTYVGAVLFTIGGLLRYWSMAVLGFRWNMRVYILDAPLVRLGPYRLLKHPIYLGVSLELAGFALAFGLWATMVAATALNLVALARRIRIEGKALRAAKA